MITACNTLIIWAMLAMRSGRHDAKDVQVQCGQDGVAHAVFCAPGKKDLLPGNGAYTSPINQRQSDLFWDRTCPCR